ncbi:sigma-70 family RNA polymerase sigma factor [Algirhabdus cladophorae]|uniref:sigma-70 family RNA polymerase sigma factor n=1 Tax=Algirhabdus cladophorae TaxID=3377108 RepID=UPI003B849A6C
MRTQNMPSPKAAPPMPVTALAVTQTASRVSTEEREVQQASTARQMWLEEMLLVRDQRDQEAFGILFRHFAPRVKAFLMKSGSTGAMAEEVSQDVMATLWRKAHLFDPTRASVATWIFTIARNRKIDVLRKQRRPEPEDLVWGPDHEPDQEDVMALQQETAQLGDALKQLPDKQRELIERAYFKDMSHSEIAVATGLPLGTIKSRIRLALERLRHVMK